MRNAAEFISRGAVRELSALRPGVFVGRLVIDWALVVLAVVAAEASSRNAWVMACAILVIGSRQHAFFILMHDATHYRGLRNRRANDLVANLFLAWPLGFSVASYRTLHLAHHRDTNGEGDPDWRRRVDDPDWQFPTSRLELCALFLRDLSGLSVIVEKGKLLVNNVRGMRQGRPFPPVSPVFLGWLLVLGGAAFFGQLFSLLLVWFLPMITVTEAIVRLRNISEHFGLPDRELIHPTRTVETASWCRFVLGMHNATHHVEHHLFPSVPFYNLGALRALLVEQPAYLISTHTTRGFRNVLRECMASADLRTTGGSRALIHFDHRTERW